MRTMRGAQAVVAVIAVAVLLLAFAGCGNGDDSSGNGTQEATESPAQESPSAVEESPTAVGDGEWTTVVTLRSDDPTDDIGLLVSEEFTVTGDARFVLDMPGGGATDGVIAAILPADEGVTVDATLEAETITLVAGVVPEEVVGGLDGTYVLFVSVPTSLAWSIEIQTRS